MDLNLIQLKIIDPDCYPTRNHAGDAGYDLRLSRDITVYPGYAERVGVGVCFGLPEGICGFVSHRSSLAFKHGCVCSYGVIDSSYTGEVQVLIFNHGRTQATFKKGDRVAQIVFAPVLYTKLEPVDSLVMGKAGFGSSGGYKNGK